MDLDRVAFDLGVEGIELVLELRLRQQLAGPRQEGLEQRPFARGQLHRPPVAMDAAGGEVDLERTVGDDGVGVAAVAARDRPDPRRELGQVEGFHEIVVRPRVQPLDPVRNLIERGQDDDRGHVAARPQPPQERDAPSVGKHQVKQHEIEGSAADRVARRIEALHPVHRMAVAGDLVAHGGAQNRVVLDQQDPHGAFPSLAASAGGHGPCRRRA